MNNSDNEASRSQSNIVKYPQSEDVAEKLGVCLDQFAKTFEASARRWELIVYPSMIAFIILAAYGFFLIYKLTNDIDAITHRVEAVAINMINVDEYMSQIVTIMDSMSTSMKTMTPAIVDQGKELSSMTSNLQVMNTTLGNMIHTMNLMRYDTASMGNNMQNMTGPMRFMNNFMPW